MAVTPRLPTSSGAGPSLDTETAATAKRLISVCFRSGRKSARLKRSSTHSFTRVSEPIQMAVTLWQIKIYLFQATNGFPAAMHIPTTRLSRHRGEHKEMCRSNKQSLSYLNITNKRRFRSAPRNLTIERLRDPPVQRCSSALVLTCSFAPRSTTIHKPSKFDGEIQSHCCDRTETNLQCTHRKSITSAGTSVRVVVSNIAIEELWIP